MGGDHLSLVELTNFFQQLLFAACVTTLLCARLIAACVAPMVQYQQPGIRFIGDLGEFF